MKATVMFSDPRFGHKDVTIRVCNPDLRSISLELQVYAANRGLMPGEVHMSIDYPPARPFYERRAHSFDLI